MNVTNQFRQLSHKVAQLKRAEERLSVEYSKFNYNNYIATARKVSELALALAKMVEI